MMTENKTFYMKFVIATCLCFGVMISCLDAYAQENSNEKVLSNAAVMKAVNLISEKEITTKELIQQNLNNKIKKVQQDLKSAQSEINRSSAFDNSAPGPLDFIMSGLKAEGVISSFSADQIDKKLKEVISNSASGHKEVENVGSGSNVNPYAGTAVMADTFLWKRFQALFCIPNSASASPECAARKGDSTIRPYENFIDFFVSEKTWPDTTVIDGLVFARRFFVGGLDKSGIGLGVIDGKSFFSQQSSIAKANLKMGVLTDLAARRAPTSTASGTVLELLLTGLMPSGQVSSTDYEDVCSNDQLTDVEAYACSFTNKPSGNGAPRVISQAAIDKIIQNDYMLSLDFYDKINSSTYSKASMERLNVFMKAQQLAQDYRALRLLQMKTAVLAMNMMNGS